MANAVATEGNQPVPLAVRNRPDEFKIEQGLHADQLPFLFQVCAGACQYFELILTFTDWRCHNRDPSSHPPKIDRAEKRRRGY